jgi:predicted nucleic acid-binding protein
MITFAGCVTMDKITEASIIYIDSNIFIYFIEATPQFFEKSKAIFEKIASVGARILTSEITVAECLYKPSQEDNKNLIRIYENLFASKADITLITLNGATTKRAAQLGGKLGLKLINAIHYISALEAGCTTFLTSDTRFKSGPQMQVMNI